MNRIIGVGIMNLFQSIAVLYDIIVNKTDSVLPQNIRINYMGWTPPLEEIIIKES